MFLSYSPVAVHHGRLLVYANAAVSVWACGFPPILLCSWEHECDGCHRRIQETSEMWTGAKTAQGRDRVVNRGRSFPYGDNPHRLWFLTQNDRKITSLFVTHHFRCHCGHNPTFSHVHRVIFYPQTSCVSCHAWSEPENIYWQWAVCFPNPFILQNIQP